MSLNTRITDWRGRRVWVIGASSGIGEAFAGALLERGARVALSARGTRALEGLARKFPSEQSMVLPVDVTDKSDIVEAYSRLRDAWSGFDLLVLLAGTHLPVRAW